MGKLLFDDALGARFMIWIPVAVQEEDSDCLDVKLLELARQFQDLGVLERTENFAIRKDAFIDLEPHGPFDQRFMFLEKKIVCVGPIDPADLVDVAKSLGRYQRGPRAGALEQRIDGYGRAMQEQTRVRERDTGPADGGINSIDKLIGCGQAFSKDDPSGLLVERRDVGKGAADIRREPKTGLRATPSDLLHASFHS